MQETGIVRRIDNLGRIVIPKEIRHSLRFHEGDTLQIFTDSQGGVTFRKYSPTAELSAFAQQYADVLSKYIKLPMLICDLDCVVSAAGIPSKDYIGCRISLELEKCMQSHKNFISTGKSKLLPVEGMERAAAIICPIIASFEVTGAVILLQNENEEAPDQTKITLVQVAATFLGKQMEI